MNKTKNKIKLKRNEEAAKAAAFRSGLKATSGPDQKFEMTEEEKRPGYKDVLDKKRGKEGKKEVTTNPHSEIEEGEGVPGEEVEEGEGVPGEEVEEGEGVPGEEVEE